MIKMEEEKDTIYFTYVTIDTTKRVDNHFDVILTPRVLEVMVSETNLEFFQKKFNSPSICRVIYTFSSPSPKNDLAKNRICAFSNYIPITINSDNITIKVNTKVPTSKIIDDISMFIRCGVAPSYMTSMQSKVVANFYR